MYCNGASVVYIRVVFIRVLLMSVVLTRLKCKLPVFDCSKMDDK